MKNLLKVFFVFLIFSSSLFAELNANYTNILELAKAKKLTKYIEDETLIKDSIDNYLAFTADFTIADVYIDNVISQTSIGTKKDLITSFINADNNLWVGFDNNLNSRDFSVRIDTFSNVDSNAKILYSIKNTYNKNNNSDTLTTSYINSIYRPSGTSVSFDVDGYSKVEFSPDSKVFSVFKTYLLANKKNIEAGSIVIHFSDKQPVSTTSVWYLPNGKGGYEIYKFDSVQNKWILKGDNTNGIMVNSLSDLTNLPCNLGDKAYVKNKNAEVIEEYICDGTTYRAGATATSGGAGQTFNGDSDLPSIANSIFDKVGGSKATADTTSYGNFGIIEFTKKENTTTGGYWVDATNNYIIAKNIAGLTTRTWNDGSIGWVTNNNGGVWQLKKIGGVWSYAPKDLQDMVVNYENKETTNNVYVVVNGVGKYFSYDSSTKIWTSTDNTYYASKLGRSSFTILGNGKTYFTNTEDCLANTNSCNGAGNTYAGTKNSNMYAFYYSTSGNRLNNLIDAIPVATVASAYAGGGSAYLMSVSNGEALSGDVLMKDTLNGNPCYKVNGNLFITQSAYLLPTHLENVLPSSKTCVGANIATFTGSGTSRAVNLTTLDDFGTRTTLPIGYKVNLSETGGISALTITRCSDSGYGNTIWSDNCGSIASAQVAITSGSRMDLVAPSSSTRKNITKQVNYPTEDNYTTTGVAYAPNTGWRQWFYSASGKIVNQMLDNPCLTINWAADFSNSRCVSPTSYYSSYAGKDRWNLGDVYYHYSSVSYRYFSNFNETIANTTCYSSTSCNPFADTACITYSGCYL